MKRILLTFGICLLTVVSSFSQTSYPSKLVIKGDTVVVITAAQLKQINVKLVERNMYMEMATTTKSFVEKLNADIIKANRLLDDKSRLISLQDSQINDLSKVIDNSNKNISLLKEEIKLQKKRKVKSTVVGITATALVTATIVSLLK